jgi:ADP-ribosyl-[dinitrogen reductase] hydrolase
MAVRVAESLVDCARLDVDDIAARYLAWWRAGAFDTGRTAARVFALVDSGFPFWAAARKAQVEIGGQAAGCNPAHRSAPLAMVPNIDTAQLAKSAKAEAKLTHHHPLSGDVAAAVVAICSELVRGAAWEEAVESASVGRQKITQTALTRHEPGLLSPGGFAPDVLAAAVHFVGANETFGMAMKEAVEFAGGANFCPVLVGSIGGARWGARSIPGVMLNHCEILARVRSVAASLAAQRVGRPPRDVASRPKGPAVLEEGASSACEPAALAPQHPRDTSPEKSTDTVFSEPISDLTSAVKHSPSHPAKGVKGPF